MSQTSLSDLIGTIKADFQKEFDAAREGRSPNNAYDGPPLPLNYEYRVEVVATEYKPSKSSGLNQYVFTWEIQEPTEFAGRKLQSYYSPKPTNVIGSEQLAKLFGSLQANLEGWGEDEEAFVGQFVGRTAVVAVDTWGEANDRFGVRWVNADRGQALSTTVKAKVKKVANNLSADIQIPKTDTPVTPPVTPPAEEPAQDQKPAVTPPSGPNLPPGLRA